MKYQKNPDMEYIDVDEETTVVFDPETEDMHYMDEVGKFILSLLDEPTELDNLLSKIKDCFEGDVAEIEADVKEFLAELCEKKVVIAN